MIKVKLNEQNVGDWDTDDAPDGYENDWICRMKTEHSASEYRYETIYLLSIDERKKDLCVLINTRIVPDNWPAWSAPKDAKPFRHKLTSDDLQKEVNSLLSFVGLFQ